MKRTVVAGGLAVGIGVPVGWIGAMASTPLLWRLEPILNMELAGHSGPADWVFYVAWAIFVPAFFLLFRTVLSREPDS